jgi:hypothetical protein
MNTWLKKSAAVAALGALSWLTLVPTVSAVAWAPGNWQSGPVYEFQLVSPPARKGGNTLVVRLIDRRTGAPISNAEIVAKRIDKVHGDAEMTIPVKQLPSYESGIYRFKAKLMTEGDWRLSLTARIPDRSGTIENALFFRVAQ